MTRDFTSHLLSFREGVFVREHPFDITSVKVRRTIGRINAVREELKRLEAILDTEVAELDKRMEKA